MRLNQQARKQTSLATNAHEIHSYTHQLELLRFARLFVLLQPLTLFLHPGLCLLLSLDLSLSEGLLLCRVQ